MVIELACTGMSYQLHWIWNGATPGVSEIMPPVAGTGCCVC